MLNFLLGPTKSVTFDMHTDLNVVQILCTSKK